MVNRAVDRRQSEDQSLPLSEQPLHRSRSKDQQFGAQWDQTFEGRLAPTISFGAIIFGRSAYLGAQVLQHPGGSLAT